MCDEQLIFCFIYILLEKYSQMFARGYFLDSQLLKTTRILRVLISSPNKFPYSAWKIFHFLLNNPIIRTGLQS